MTPRLATLLVVVISVAACARPSPAGSATGSITTARTPAPLPADPCAALSAVTAQRITGSAAPLTRAFDGIRSSLSECVYTSSSTADSLSLDYFALIPGASATEIASTTEYDLSCGTCTGVAVSGLGDVAYKVLSAMTNPPSVAYAFAKGGYIVTLKAAGTSPPAVMDPLVLAAALSVAAAL